MWYFHRSSADLKESFSIRIALFWKFITKFLNLWMKRKHELRHLRSNIVNASRFLLLFFLVIYLIWIRRHQLLTCYPFHQALPHITIGCFEASTSLLRTTFSSPFAVVNQIPFPDVSEAACTGIGFSLAITYTLQDHHAFIELNRTTVFNSPA